ncbi:hypothetical protein L9F63_013021 [Diploptera punctata]|uniref:Complementary sex determination N-terminal domain-containing protein n=1 Tax=Diploptera punctata TaxID=6984 RepID=A0AAD8AB39_DIPPU|nr:hypothetical protein L9F63_013021 [Diploptera punctata]
MRSPRRRTTPPPPHNPHRMPGGFSMRRKSPDRKRRMGPPRGIDKFVPVPGRIGSPPRSREHRREFRNSPKRHRSPLHREPKVHSFSPGKRKITSPKRELERVRLRDSDRGRMRSRELDRQHRPPRSDQPPPRKRTRSKSVEGGDGIRMGSYPGPVQLSPPRMYQDIPASYPEATPPAPYPQAAPPGPDRDEPPRMTMSERFYALSGPQGFKKESDNPVFRGPEGSGFDINELKKITVDLRREVPAGMDSAERNIIKPEDVLLRRPEVLLDILLREGQHLRGLYDNEATPSGSCWQTSWANEINHYIHNTSKREGSRPIFDKIMQEARMNTGPVEEHRRVVAILDEAPPIEPQGSLRRVDERDNGDYPRATSSRFESPGRYSDPRPRSRSRDGYYPPLSEREPLPLPSRGYERSHGPGPGFEPRESIREETFDRHSSAPHHEVDLRRRDENRYPSQESRRYDYIPPESGRNQSDLRMRINEKRIDHRDDRDHRMMEPQYPERDWPHRGMMQPSPPGDHRRGPVEEFGRPVEAGRMYGSGEGRMMHHSSDNRQGPPDRFHHEVPADRFHHKSWNSNPEHVPKGRGYFQR